MTDVDGPNDNVSSDIQPVASQIEQSSGSNLTNGTVNDTIPSKRPRDARLVHLILAHYGCTSYQERVPLQLMDFAYRYTSSVLQDALHLTNEGYGTAGAGAGTGPGTGKGIGGAGAGSGDGNSVVGMSAVRLAIHSRTHYQYSPTLPKEVMMDLAQDRNRIGLPQLQKEFGGMRLPPEQFLLTGQGWQLAEEFDMDDMDALENGDAVMLDQEICENGDGEEEGGTMEDIFGPGGAGEGDAKMLEG